MLIFYLSKLRFAGNKHALGAGGRGVGQNLHFCIARSITYGDPALATLLLAFQAPQPTELLPTGNHERGRWPRLKNCVYAT